MFVQINWSLASLLQKRETISLDLLAETETERERMGEKDREGECGRERERTEMWNRDSNAASFLPISASSLLTPQHPQRVIIIVFAFVIIIICIVASTAVAAAAGATFVTRDAIERQLKVDAIP